MKLKTGIESIFRWCKEHINFLREKEKQLSIEFGFLLTKRNIIIFINCVCAYLSMKIILEKAKTLITAIVREKISRSEASFMTEQINYVKPPEKIISHLLVWSGYGKDRF